MPPADYSPSSGMCKTWLRHGDLAGPIPVSPISNRFVNIHGEKSAPIGNVAVVPPVAEPTMKLSEWDLIRGVRLALPK